MAPQRPPATTPEGRENQLIALAVDLAEKQLRDGTASAQVQTHFLKLATTRERLEQKRLEHEIELLRSKTEQLASAANMEKLYTEAIAVMRSYQGHEPVDEGPSYDDDPEVY